MNTQRRITEAQTETVDFGYLDTSGRKIGALIQRHMTEYYEKPEWTGGYSTAPGVYFSADVHAARNGYRFGASNRAMDFDSNEAREEWIAKRIEDNRKRARKIAEPSAPITVYMAR